MAFYSSGLTTVNIPDSVEEIGKYAFSHTPWIENYPDDFVIVGKNILLAYTGNKANVTIPNSVVSIGEGAFFGCRELTDVNLPNSLTDIGVDAFYGTGITSIVIPKSVTTLGAYCFSNCTELNDVYIQNPNVVIESYSFGWVIADMMMMPYKIENTIIHGYKNSTAEAYAKDNDITFIEINNNSDTDSDSKPAKDKDTDSDSKPAKDKDSDSDTSPKPTKTLHHGNIDGDETITSADALIVLRASVGLEKLTEEQKYFADVNGDGDIDSADSLSILRYSVGLKDSGLTIGFNGN